MAGTYIGETNVPTMVYTNFGSSQDLFSTAEKYVGRLKEYGYEVANWEDQIAARYYLMYLPDSDLEWITMPEGRCHIYVKADAIQMADQPYAYGLEVAYSPSIRDYYMEAPSETQPAETAPPETEPSLADLYDIPPTLTDLYGISLANTTMSDHGFIGLNYARFDNLNHMTVVLEDYLAVLEDHGYTIEHEKIIGDDFFQYGLDSWDTTLKTTVNGYHLYISAMAYEDSGYYSFIVYYSPSYIDYYIDESTPGYSSGSSSGGSILTPSNNSLPHLETQCTSCFGSGKKSCSNCSGYGYKEKTVSAPNYSGKSSTSKTVKETCFKCHGSGTVECSSCGGRGKK